MQVKVRVEIHTTQEWPNTALLDDMELAGWGVPIKQGDISWARDDNGKWYEYKIEVAP